MSFDQEKLGEDELVEELIDKSQHLARIMGFEKGRRFSINEIDNLLAAHRQDVKSVLELVYDHPDPKVKSELVNTPELQRAFLMNIQKMLEYGKVRKNSAPFYIHPQEVSRTIFELGQGDHQLLKEGVIAGLLHDYLEEGDGTSSQTVNELNSGFRPFSTRLAHALPLLTEPYYLDNGQKENPKAQQYIDYDRLKHKIGHDRKTLEALIYASLIKESPIMQLVVPADKINNVGDCEIVQRAKARRQAQSPEQMSDLYRKYMIQVMASYLFFLDFCHGQESQKLKRDLHQKIMQKIFTLEHSDSSLRNFSREVKLRLQAFRSLYAHPAIQNLLNQEIHHYYGALGIKI